MKIFSYETKSGEIFFGLRIKSGGLQREKRGFKTKGAAEKGQSTFHAEVIREVEKQRILGASYGQLLNDWELQLRLGRGSKRPLEPTTIEDNVRVLQIYSNHWERKLAAEITPGEVFEVLNRMEEEDLSAARRRCFLGALNGLFRWGIQTRRVICPHGPPTLGISAPRNERESEPQVLSKKEIHHFLTSAQTCDHPWYLIWAFALLTGMRSGEMQALLWEDVGDKEIRVRHSYNGRTKVIKAPKNGCWRDVPINSHLRLVLVELKRKHPGQQEVLPTFSEWRRGKGAEVLRAFLAQIGLKPIRFHDLRACFATQMLLSGVPAVTVMKIGGWKDLETMQIYIRLAAIEIHGATDALQILPAQEAMENVVHLFPTTPG